MCVPCDDGCTCKALYHRDLDRAKYNQNSSLRAGQGTQLDGTRTIKHFEYIGSD
jgi:hypothetical protein